MLPAQAGVILKIKFLDLVILDAPRAGGGDPIAHALESKGWKMLPAQAGVILYCCSAAISRIDAPRAGGGDPYNIQNMLNMIKCSPRRRG